MDYIWRILSFVLLTLLLSSPSARARPKVGGWSENEEFDLEMIDTIRSEVADADDFDRELGQRLACYGNDVPDDMAVPESYTKVLAGTKLAFRIECVDDSGDEVWVEVFRPFPLGSSGRPTEVTLSDETPSYLRPPRNLETEIPMPVPGGWTPHDDFHIDTCRLQRKQWRVQNVDRVMHSLQANFSCCTDDVSTGDIVFLEGYKQIVNGLMTFAHVKCANSKQHVWLNVYEPADDTKQIVIQLFYQKPNFLPTKVERTPERIQQNKLQAIHRMALILAGGWSELKPRELDKMLMVQHRLANPDVISEALSCFEGTVTEGVGFGPGYKQIVNGVNFVIHLSCDETEEEIWVKFFVQDFAEQVEVEVVAFEELPTFVQLNYHP